MGKSCMIGERDYFFLLENSQSDWLYQSGEKFSFRRRQDLFPWSHIATHSFFTQSPFMLGSRSGWSWVDLITVKPLPSFRSSLHICSMHASNLERKLLMGWGNKEAAISLPCSLDGDEVESAMWWLEPDLTLAVGSAADPNLIKKDPG